MALRSLPFPRGFDDQEPVLWPFRFLLLSLSAPATRANTLDFTLKGDGNIYTFQLPSNPNPTGGVNNLYFAVANVIVTDNGSELAAAAAFYFERANGGMTLVRDLPQLTGPQLFLVNLAGFTFINGSYSLLNTQDDNNYSLTIADDAPGGAAAPEPSTWAMMAIGFSGLSFMGWRWRRRLPIPNRIS